LKPFLSVKKSLLAGAGVAIIALAVPGVASVAQADTPPADQVVLDGSCLSLGDVISAAEQAIAAYVPGGPPAGVTVNNTWVPAVALLTNAGQFADDLGTCNQVAPATTNDPTDPPSTGPNGTDPNGTDPNGTDPNGPPSCHWRDHGHHHGWGQQNWGQNGGQNWGQNGGQNWGQNGGQNWGQNGGQNGGQQNGGQNWGQ
jgi:hypothetical protein